MDLANKLRHVHHYPKHGIDFIDITTVLKDQAAFHQLIEEMAAACQDLDFNVIVGAEARGFILGAALAYKLQKSFVPIRKAGKLPAESYRLAYELEYGQAEIELHKDALSSSDKVLFVDDLLAVGGTAQAACELIEISGAQVAALLFFIELDGLNGREKLEKYQEVKALYVVKEDPLD